MVIQQPEVGDIWQHWKGTRYEIISIAKRENDGSPQVVYRSPTGEEWVRPLWEFVQKVTLRDGRQVQRFTLVLASVLEVEQIEQMYFEDTNPVPQRCVPLAEDTTVVPW